MSAQKKLSGSLLVLMIAALMLMTVALTGCPAAPVHEGLTDEQLAALTPDQRVFVLEADYLVNKSDFVRYAEQPACVAPNVAGCHDPKVVKEVRRLDREIQVAFKAARVATGEDLAAQAALIRTLTNRFYAELVKYGIAKAVGA